MEKKITYYIIMETSKRVYGKFDDLWKEVENGVAREWWSKKRHHPVFKIWTQNSFIYTEQITQTIPKFDTHKKPNTKLSQNTINIEIETFRVCVVFTVAAPFPPNHIHTSQRVCNRCCNQIQQHRTLSRISWAQNVNGIWHTNNNNNSLTFIQNNNIEFKFSRKFSLS